MLGKILAKTSFNTQAAFVDRTFCVTLNTHDLITPCTQVYGTAYTAVGADGPDFPGRLLGLFSGQGTGGAPGQALTAGFTNGFQQRLVVEGANPGIITTKCKINRSDTGDLIAGTNTPAAEDALVRITVKCRVPCIEWQQAGRSAHPFKTLTVYAQVLGNIL